MNNWNQKKSVTNLDLNDYSSDKLKSVFKELVMGNSSRKVFLKGELYPKIEVFLNKS